MKAPDNLWADLSCCDQRDKLVDYVKRLQAWCDRYDIPHEADPNDRDQDVWQVLRGLNAEQVEMILEMRCPYASHCPPGESIVVNCRCRKCQDNNRGAWDPRR